MLGCEMSMFGMGWWMWFPGLLVLGALVTFGLWSPARFAPRGAGRSLRILEERLARGEIDDEEFHHLRATLEGSR